MHYAQFNWWLQLFLLMTSVFLMSDSSVSLRRSDKKKDVIGIGCQENTKNGSFFSVGHQIPPNLFSLFFFLLLSLSFSFFFLILPLVMGGVLWTFKLILLTFCRIFWQMNEMEEIAKKELYWSCYLYFDHRICQLSS